MDLCLDPFYSSTTKRNPVQTMSFISNSFNLFVKASDVCLAAFTQVLVLNSNLLAKYDFFSTNIFSTE